MSDNKKNLYMSRAIELSTMAYNNCYPNPRVGAVLVYNDRIIGEGYHETYGQAHAEVNCINSVSTEDQHLISKSTLYVSLEPCTHEGKTPSCAHRIITEKIQKVVVATRDPNEDVAGNGIAFLESQGVEVITGIMKEEAYQANKHFLFAQKMKRPYTMLKWAEDKNGIMGYTKGQVAISSTNTNKLTMSWRAEYQAILVGKNTVLIDNPMLSNRSGHGKDPWRFVMDSNLEILQSNESLNVLHCPPETYILNLFSNSSSYPKEVRVRGKDGKINLESMVDKLFEINIISIIIEGGSQVLKSFIENDLYDELRVIQSKKSIKDSIAAPYFDQREAQEEISLDQDTIYIYQKPTPFPMDSL